MLITREMDYAIRAVRALADGEKHNIKEICSMEDIPTEFGYKAVSYTHLDVYKRQPLPGGSFQKGGKGAVAVRLLRLPVRGKRGPGHLPGLPLPPELFRRQVRVLQVIAVPPAAVDPPVFSSPNH